MDPRGELHPDPPSGIGYGDFLAARERFRLLLRQQSEIRRLEQALALPAPVGEERSDRATDSSARPETEGEEGCVR